MKISIPAGEFKAKCLKLLDDVAEKRQTLVVTKRGCPVAEVIPLPVEVDPFGSMKGSANILGDIVSPLDVEWKALK